MQIGDRAKDFELPDQHGELHRLYEMLESGPVVLFFYPAAMTAGCTRESCHFRDLAKEFKELGAQRVGISADPPAKQKQFAEKYGFDYPLLCDTERKVAEAYGVRRRLLPALPVRRTTLVIDSDGTIKQVISSELNFNVHADRALEALRQMAGN